MIQFAWSAVTQAQAQVRSQQEANANAATAPPAGSPAAVVSNLWNTYGSSIIAGISRASAGTSGTQMNEQNANAAATSGLSDSQSVPQTRNPYTAAE